MRALLLCALSEVLTRLSDRSGAPDLGAASVSTRQISVAVFDPCFDANFADDPR